MTKIHVYRSDLQFYSSVVFTGLDREVQMIYSEEGIWEVGAYGMEILPSYHKVQIEISRKKYCMPDSIITEDL